MNGAAEPITRRNWWHRNRGWLAGALVLGALAFYLPYRDAQAEFDKGAPRHRIDPGADGWGDYEGSRWRITGVEFEPGAGKAVADYPHAPGSLVLVHYEVVPGASTTARELDACKGRLTDAGGRQWHSNEPYKLVRRLRSRDLDGYCGRRAGKGLAPRAEARAGQPFAFSHAFLVPAAMDPSGLRADIFLPPMRTTPRGSYLSFALPPPKR